MAVFTVSASIGTSSDFSTVKSWNDSLSGEDFVTLANVTDWASAQVYAIGTIILADSTTNIYICATAITSSDTEPTGTGSGISDDDGTWDFVGAASGNKLIYEGLLKNESHTQNSAVNIGSGVTMDDDGYIILKCAASGSFIDNATLLDYDESKGAHLHMTAHASDLIQTSRYAHIFGIQLMTTGASLNNIFGSGKVYRNIILNECTNTTRAALKPQADSSFVNNLVIMGTDAAHDAQGMSTNGSSGKVAFNTVVRATDAGAATSKGFAIHVIGVAERYRNNCFYGFSTALDQTGGGTITATQWDNNITDGDDDGGKFPDGNNLYGRTYSTSTPFEDSEGVGRDFSAKSGSALDGAGVDLSGDTATFISADVDIFGTARAATPTVGCFEIVAAGGSILPHVQHHHRTMRAA